MDILINVASNFRDPPILFFFLGMLATVVKSDLSIPIPIAKFLSLYLLLCIGMRGGAELSQVGFSFTVFQILAICILASFITPFLVYKILRMKVSIYDAAMIAASYGSVSAVTFITTGAFLEERQIAFDSFMVAGLALMESPAIIAALLIVKLSPIGVKTAKKSETNLGKSVHEALTNSSVLVLLGSLVIGALSGYAGMVEMKPFVGSIFKGMLCIYMLDMGLIAGTEFSLLRKSGLFLCGFALLFSPVAATIMICIAKLIHLNSGNALLLTMLGSSASYIAVPAAMRFALPSANLSLLMPMALGITFTFNIALGIPFYYAAIQWAFGS